MASKLIIQRQKAAGASRAALSVFDDEVTPALGERLSAFLKPGEAAFDFHLLQAVLERMVAASLHTLIDADKAHLDETAGDGTSRHQRDGAVWALRRKLVEIRGIVKGLFGAKHAAEIVAIDGRTAMQPDLLWRQGEHTLDRLRAPELQLPEATTKAVGFDRSQLGDELEPLVTALRQTTDTVELDRQQAATTLATKKAAMAEHDALMGACGRTLTGLHQLAGRSDLARRIRVTPPRKKSAQAAPSVDGAVVVRQGAAEDQVAAGVVAAESGPRHRDLLDGRSQQILGEVGQGMQEGRPEQSIADGVAGVEHGVVVGGHRRLQLTGLEVLDLSDGAHDPHAARQHVVDEDHGHALVDELDDVVGHLVVVRQLLDDQYHLRGIHRGPSYTPSDPRLAVSLAGPGPAPELRAPAYLQAGVALHHRLL